jgi:hypothetical protein
MNNLCACTSTRRGKLDFNTQKAYVHTCVGKGNKKTQHEQETIETE